MTQGDPQDTMTDNKQVSHLTVVYYLFFSLVRYKVQSLNGERIHQIKEEVHVCFVLINVVLGAFIDANGKDNISLSNFSDEFTSSFSRCLNVLLEKLETCTCSMQSCYIHVHVLISYIITVLKMLQTISLQYLVNVKKKI